MSWALEIKVELVADNIPPFNELIVLWSVWRNVERIQDRRTYWSWEVKKSEKMSPKS